MLLSLLLAQIGTGVASAQSPNLVTDRPDQTESATVVPRGLMQVETGYLFARDGGVDGYEVPGTLSGSVSAPGQNSALVTRAWSAEKDVTARVIASLAPRLISSSARTAGGPSSQFWAACRSRPVTTRSRAEASIRCSSLRSPTNSRQGCRSATTSGRRGSRPPISRNRDAFILYSLALGVGLTDRLGTFLELFGDRQTTDTAATSVSVDGGFTLLLTDIVQLDVYVGSGLRGRADDVFAGTG